MLKHLPAPLQELWKVFTGFPGIGPKSALRMVMEILTWPEEKVQNIGKIILTFREKLKPCVHCGLLSEEEECSICRDPSRDASLLCVVADLDSYLVLEEAGFYRGKYFILGGLYNPLEDKELKGINLEGLRKRLADPELKELILALGATVEAENTASYIKNMVSRDFSHLILSRLAQGIPLGAEVKYMDQETLKQSLNFRQKI
ncbi:MAG: recombination protein RecR [Desulfonauticus sp.]|jgi:recombination protein RecR|nr:MAG: Recombination protein RecR [Desulfonauticus sp. 38_4375]MDK2920797.1 recombination protein RecR [Desulfonauticus sp.]